MSYVRKLGRLITGRRNTFTAFRRTPRRCVTSNLPDLLIQVRPIIELKSPLDRNPSRLCPIALP